MGIRLMWGFYIVFSIVVLIYIIQFIGDLVFNKKVKNEVRQIFEKIQLENSKQVTLEDLEKLPEPMKRFMMKSGIIGSERIKTVRLKQAARIRMSENSRWFAYKTVQYFNAENPSFIWYASMPLFAGLSMKVRDKMINSKGDMLGKVFSIIPVVTGAGPKIDQGSLVRFVGEMAWFPSAFLYDYCKWETIDNFSAKLTININGVEVIGKFAIDENDNLKSFECPRWMDVDDTEMKTYMNYFEQHEIRNGVKIPVKGKAVWKLEKGELIYWDGVITSIEYNIKEQF